MAQTGPAEAPGLPPYFREGMWRWLSKVYDPLIKLVLLLCGGEKKVRGKFIDFARLKGDETVLDICCGTGTLTLMLAERLEKGAVIGLDLSQDMLEVASRRAGRANTSFRRGNSEAMPFPDGAFDSAFVSFALHEMPEDARVKTLEETRRVLKPGSSLFILDYALPGGGRRRVFMKGFVKLVEEDYSYRMIAGEQLPRDIRQAGFSLERQELICGGAGQLIEARSPGS